VGVGQNVAAGVVDGVGVKQGFVLVAEGVGVGVENGELVTDGVSDIVGVGVGSGKFWQLQLYLPLPSKNIVIISPIAGSLTTSGLHNEKIKLTLLPPDTVDISIT
jgi:hypothetical protein